MTKNKEREFDIRIVVDVVLVIRIDDTTLELICMMLTMDPAQRPSAEECLAHRFFSQSPSVATNSE